MKPIPLLVLLYALFHGPFVHAGDDGGISEARKEENGILVHEVRSLFQAKTTQIRVLTPQKLDKDKKYPVIYVLPVESGSESRYGDGLKEILKHNLHNTTHTIFVTPTFTQLPWYADHPSNPEIRQESYFLRVVVPLIDKTYPVTTESKGRLLLGFSKSGWGAWSLLLRHPHLFGKAVAWDAPLLMDKPGKYGSGEIFGTTANFEGYHIARLLEAKAKLLGKENRLALLGYGNFREQHQQTHALLTQLRIPHIYRDGPSRPHDWHSGWVLESVHWLLDDS